MPIRIEGVTPSDEVRSALKGLGEPVLLGYSCGKDSTAAWIALLESGCEVVPVHLYAVPGLSFVEEYLEYAESWFGTPILRVPHPSLFRMLNYKLFQPHRRSAAIDRLHLPIYDVDGLFDAVRADLGLPGAWSADGIRANDSLERRAMVMRHGPMRERSRKASAIWDWSADETRDYLDSFGIEGPPDYAMFGTSFDGVSSRFVGPIRELYPDDYETIKAWFPLVDLDVLREERYGV